ncbi:hypothetical protein F0562_032521 [Nyssa sinensis]|uniref:RNA-dependent RNA polymerase n=1 Tax=Nyssa sinensis TaxID=561372 RepID=A0A5J5AQD8_9ASTE|nr:hypothetical protein F0562_032521 [Nyssa sinensis]
MYVYTGLPLEKYYKVASSAGSSSALFIDSRIVAVEVAALSDKITWTGWVRPFMCKGTVDAVEVWQSKKGRACAKVQFTTTGSAEYIISLANQRLWYGSSYLKAWAMDSDIMPKSNAYLHIMEGMTLHSGCQISREKFSVLWDTENVTVKFGLGLRKMHFLLSYLSVEYKLELSYENIWQIELHCPRGQTAKFLIIQLLGAPRIYEKLEDSVFSFFKETTDDQWFRGIDFTPFCCLGQSSALCLEFPYGVPLPDFGEHFAYYKENENQFILESGFSFSHNLDLVPIVGPPQECELPYKILFKICSLVQHGSLPGPALDINFFRLVDPQTIDIAYIEHALEKLYYLKDCCYEPVRWLTEQYGKYLTSRQLPKPPAITLDAGLVYVRRVLVTPCKVYFCGPEVNVSNRVLRNYPEDIDNFLRVSFVDEELAKLYSTDLSPRIASSMRKGKLAFIIGYCRFLKMA